MLVESLGNSVDPLLDWVPVCDGAPFADRPCSHCEADNERTSEGIMTILLSSLCDVDYSWDNRSNYRAYATLHRMPYISQDSKEGQCDTVGNSCLPEGTLRIKQHLGPSSDQRHSTAPNPVFPSNTYMRLTVPTV